jgi:DNA/RNA-binding protein KIN17
MPKAEKGSAKDVANKSKAKGLQKLKFYCQMCEKQCRDQNGFKCHMTSETHLRNMKIFAENAGGMLDSMSKDFENNYLETLRRRHGTKRVSANGIYQEVIQDKFHIHMNATKWPTLSDFCQYLGRRGKCVVDETERGWYVQYIERDAGILDRAEAQKKRVEAEQAAEIRYEAQMKLQREEAAKALDRAGGTMHNEATELKRDDATAKVALSLNGSSSAGSKKVKSATPVSGFGVDEEDDDEEQPPPPAPFIPVVGTRNKEEDSKKRKRPDDKSTNTKEKKRALKPKADRDRKDYWLRRDILVRIVSKKLADGKYFKRKGVVDRVLDDKFTAEVEVLDSGPDKKDGGDILRLDQDDVDTVVPKEGKSVRILNGTGRGKKAKVVSLNPDRYRATLKMEDGTVLEKVDYADFSKMA